MKRALPGNVKVFTDTLSQGVIDREGFLSAVVGGTVDTAGDVTIVVKDCDTENGTFADVTDDWLFIGGGSGTVTAAADELVNVDVDLVGCKRYVKFVTTFDEVAVVLGDAAIQPV